MRRQKIEIVKVEARDCAACDHKAHKLIEYQARVGTLKKAQIGKDETIEKLKQELADAAAATALAVQTLASVISLPHVEEDSSDMSKLLFLVNQAKEQLEISGDSPTTPRNGGSLTNSSGGSVPTIVFKPRSNTISPAQLRSPNEKDKAAKSEKRRGSFKRRSGRSSSISVSSSSNRLRTSGGGSSSSGSGKHSLKKNSLKRNSLKRTKSMKKRRSSSDGVISVSAEEDGSSERTASSARKFTAASVIGILSGQTRCAECQEAFTFFNHPDVCDSCGRTVCGKCAFDFGAAPCCGVCWPSIIARFEKMKGFSAHEDRHAVDAYFAIPRSQRLHPLEVAGYALSDLDGVKCVGCKRELSMMRRVTQCSGCSHLCCGSCCKKYSLPYQEEKVVSMCSSCAASIAETTEKPLLSARMILSPVVSGPTSVSTCCQCGNPSRKVISCFFCGDSVCPTCQNSTHVMDELPWQPKIKSCQECLPFSRGLLFLLLTEEGPESPSPLELALNTRLNVVVQKCNELGMKFSLTATSHRDCLLTESTAEGDTDDNDDTTAAVRCCASCNSSSHAIGNNPPRRCSMCSQVVCGSCAVRWALIGALQGVAGFGCPECFQRAVTAGQDLIRRLPVVTLPVHETFSAELVAAKRPPVHLPLLLQLHNEGAQQGDSATITTTTTSCVCCNERLAPERGAAACRECEKPACFRCSEEVEFGYLCANCGPAQQPMQRGARSLVGYISETEMSRFRMADECNICHKSFHQYRRVTQCAHCQLLFCRDCVDTRYSAADGDNDSPQAMLLCRRCVTTESAAGALVNNCLRCETQLSAMNSPVRCTQCNTIVCSLQCARKDGRCYQCAPQRVRVERRDSIGNFGLQLSELKMN